MDRRQTRWLLAPILSIALLVPAAAAAADDEGKVEKVVVRNRVHRAKGTFEVNPGVGFSLTNQLVEHTNIELGLAYNLFETFAIELRPGYALGKHTSVAEQVQAELYSKSPFVGVAAGGSGNIASSATVDDFQDLWQLQWQALLMPRWQPIYGKVNLATELPIHFQTFLTAGGGLVGLHRESVVYCQNGVGATGGGRGAECQEYLTEDRQSPALAFGGGFRFYVTDWAILKLELFDVAFPDVYREKVTRLDAEQETAGAEPAIGAEASNPGFSNILFFNLGTSFFF